MEKYLITNIKYSIEDEDISAYLEERDSSTLAIVGDIDYTEEEWEKAREEIQKSLPQSFVVEIDEDYDDLEEALNNAISDETGWCIETYEPQLIMCETDEEDPLIKGLETIIADYLNNTEDLSEDERLCHASENDFQKLVKRIAHKVADDAEVRDIIESTIEYYAYRDDFMLKKGE